MENQARIKKIFDEPEWYLNRTAYNITLRSEIVLEFLGDRRFDSILDIGCGDGSLSRKLLNKNNRLTLLDQSVAMLDIARSRVPAEFASQVRTINGDCTRSELEPGGFDLILCIGVLAYIPDRREFISKIRSFLKPGGTLLIECTDSAHIVSGLVRSYQSLLNLVKPSKASTIIGSSKSVTGICEDLGFRRVSSFRYSLPLPVINKMMSQKSSYNAIRSIYGSARKNSLGWLGNECLYHYELPAR